MLDRKLLRVGIAGQTVSLCLVGTSATSSLLARRGWSMPMFQSFITYFMIGLFYTSILSLEENRLRSPRPRGGFCSSGLSERMLGAFIGFALADVEANFFIVRAYQFTSLTSVTLLDCFTIPCVVLLSYIFLGSRYTRLHLLGVAISVAGLVLLVYTDLSKAEGSESSLPSADTVYGDSLTLIAATLYAISNILQEGLTEIEDWRRVLSGLGCTATVISGIQCLALEHRQLADYQWMPWDVALLGIYAVSLFLIYSMVPKILMASGATFLNISLLTSDFWAVLFGVTVLKEQLEWTYFVSFAATIVGLVIYHSNGEPVKASRERQAGEEEEEEEEEEEGSRGGCEQSAAVGGDPAGNAGAAAAADTTTTTTTTTSDLAAAECGVLQAREGGEVGEMGRVVDELEGANREEEGRNCGRNGKDGELSGRGEGGVGGETVALTGSAGDFEEGSEGLIRNAGPA